MVLHRNFAMDLTILSLYKTFLSVCVYIVYSRSSYHCHYLHVSKFKHANPQDKYFSVSFVSSVQSFRKTWFTANG